MSKLAKCLCGLYICSSTFLPLTYDNTKLNNIASNEAWNISSSEIKLTANSKNEEINDISKDLKKHGQVVNIDSNLCIRKNPNKNGSVYYGLYKGMIFDILDKEGEWYKIKHDYTTGYVHKDYVKEYDEIPPYPVYDMPKDIKINDNKIKISRGGEIGTPIKAELTAYCNCASCSESWGKKTAMQTQTRIGVIAAPKNVPLGSKMFIPELKSYKSDCIFNVEDRGGAIKIKNDGTYIIDVWLPSHDKVKKFGRKRTVIYLLN
ncbi:SH3 domain-containing protein [Clostridium uliginosum]|uniref:3D (Asp-Asp-Asp) domain-containing protein n=1 Tax=Clostridium uliginosum TaxID=119641 RepID=A0A1I1MKA2_9CLOT|nr:SH3 domain-containing protein [Clostridium uliginosum]SFC85252.1 3D (Asp-Asp-Asp) domain-containing protein [Clostridium uliginosum]